MGCPGWLTPPIPTPVPSHLALQVGRLLLPVLLHVDDLHDVAAPEALLLHLLGRTDVGQGDGADPLPDGGWCSVPPQSWWASTSSCAPLTSAPGLLAKLRASPVRQKWSFLAAHDSSGPLPRVLWTKSSPSFTTAAGGLRSLPSPPSSSSSVPTSRVMKAFIWLAPCCRAGCSGASQASLALPAAGSMLPTIWMACRPRDGGVTTTVTSLPSIPCRPLSHLGQEQQRAAGARVGVRVPQVEELGGHDGRREEAEAEEAGDGHELGVLRPHQDV